MSNEKFPLFNNKNDQRYHKVWMAAMNPSEFQRLMRFDNCELISVPFNCNEITLKLTEEASLLASTDLQHVHKPMCSFMIASQLFIGLIYVHEQQVKFLYDLVSRCTIPTIFLIENQNSPKSENASPAKKALKRKSSTKVRESLKRKISLALGTSDDDIETQNEKTMELLQNAFVSNNADISIRESFDDSRANEVNEPMYLFDMQFNEETAPERSDFNDSALLQDDDLMSTLNQQQSMDEPEVPINMWESTRRQNSEVGIDTMYAESRDPEIPDIEPTDGVSDKFSEMDIGPDAAIDLIEMETLDESNIPDPSNKDSSRKRKRRQPFKDVTLNVNVKENVKTAATTQRHSNSKDDSVSRTTCLNNLSRKIFDKPNHCPFSESMSRQFESRSMSSKLLESFNRMALTKTESTNRDLVQEFCSNPSDMSAPNFEISNVNVAIPCQATESSLPLYEVPVDPCYSEPASMLNNFTQVSIEPEPIDEPPMSCALMPVEFSSEIRQILAANESLNPFTRCETDSQKLFASRSRQNKLDWGTEGVLKKLMSLWNSGIHPIGMNEIMESSKHRISAATAFFSVMELNSARIGLINITKSGNSNIIFDIQKSPKLIELQQMV